MANLLFLCVHNAGRSQMAAGFARQLSAETVTVYSGGSDPADFVNPTAVEVMNEIGIDIETSKPKRWSDSDIEMADVIVTMGCGDECPYVPGRRYLDWPLDDPAGRPIEEVRTIRDDIRRRVEQLLTEMGWSGAQS